MSRPDERFTPNTLLGALSADDLELLKHLTRVQIAREQMLVSPNQPIEHVYFPEGGIASIVSVMAQSGD